MRPEVHKWLEEGNMDWVEESYFAQPKNISWTEFVYKVYEDVVEFGGYTIAEID